MLKKIITCSTLALASLLPVNSSAKHPGEYLHEVTTEYATPHLNWLKEPASKLKVLFIVPRTGAREVVELHQRMPMDYTAFVTINQYAVSKESMYEAAIAGTSAYEKKQELLEKLNAEYDLIVLGSFDFNALPEEAQFKILIKVTDGTGLLLVHPGKLKQLPYKKVYQNKLPSPLFLEQFSVSELPGIKITPDKLFEAWQLGKGRVAQISYHTAHTTGLSLTPQVFFHHFWQSSYENNMAFLALCAQWTAHGDIAESFKCPELQATPAVSIDGAVIRLQTAGEGKVFFRVRNLDNQVIASGEVLNDELKLPSLPGGKYFCDIQVEKNKKFVTCGFYSFNVASPTGKLVLTAPEVVNDQQELKGVFKMEKAFNAPAQLILELMDSPYNRVWHRETFQLAAGQRELEWRMKNYYVPTLAGYVRARVYDGQKKELAWTERLIFFPDYRLNGYVQMGWDILPITNGMLYAPQLIDNFGWNLGLTHPRPEGENLRIAALLNQRTVPYMTRIVLRKDKQGGIKQFSWFFLPKEKADEVKKLEGDECFYRPEVKELWQAAIAHRIKNLPKYSPVIYNLGDENGYHIDGGYGPSDLKYFREFLKEKYGTVSKLNLEWRSNYRDFSDVPHLEQKHAKASGNFAAWYDHHQYIEKMYADLHHFLAKEIKKYDPRAKVGAEGSMPGNLEQTICGLEFWGPYSDIKEDEALRSLGRDRIRMLWWGGYMSSHGGRGKWPFAILSDILKGTITGSAWYSANVTDPSSGFGVDYSPAQYLKDYAPYLHDLRWGVADLLINTPLLDSGVYIYWSPASNSARMLDERCPDPSDSIISLIRYCYTRGVNFEYVSSRTLERLKKAKVLFLCGASALSEEENKAILNFVQQGGTVVGDLNPAILNGYLRPVEANPLKDIFGDITFNKVKPPQLRPVNIDADLNGVGIKLQAQKGMAAPDSSLFEVRKVGKGTSILLNFSLASAENTADKATPYLHFLDNILAGSGIKPTYGIQDCDRSTIVRIRSGNGFNLIGALVQKAQIGSSLEVDLPEECYIYECKKGFVGKGKKLELDFKNTPFRLYALFPEKQAPPIVKPLKSVVSRGGILELDMDKLPKGRVYLVQLFDPSGGELLNRNQLFDTTRNFGKLPIHLAFTDSPGNWFLVINDVATGLASKIEFKVD